MSNIGLVIKIRGLIKIYINGGASEREVVNDKYIAHLYVLIKSNPSKAHLYQIINREEMNC